MCVLHYKKYIRLKYLPVISIFVRKSATSRDRPNSKHSRAAVTSSHAVSRALASEGFARSCFYSLIFATNMRMTNFEKTFKLLKMHGTISPLPPEKTRQIAVKRGRI